MFGKLFKKSDPLSAAEAVARAREALTTKRWPPAADAHLWSVYTAVMDSNREITPEGRCVAWHVDFYSPQENAAYVMRIDGEKIKGRDKRPGKGLDYPSLEHVYACAGDFPGEVRLEPREFPKKWPDSTVFAPKAMAYLREQVDEDTFDRYAPVCVLGPAEQFSYLQADRFGKLIRTRPNDTSGFIVLLGSEEVDEADTFAVYTDLKSGEIIHAERFRFPELFDHGYSADW